MDDFTEVEIARLEVELAGRYQRGVFSALDQVAIDGLWARIERLTASRASLLVGKRKRAAVLLTISELKER